MTLSLVAQAYTLAHRRAEHPSTPAIERAYFRTIAYTLWKACAGELYPTNLEVKQ
jgi:hypothetical protein